MKKFRIIFGLVRGFKKRLISNFVFNILNAIFSLFTFAALVPFLQILFRTEDETQAVKGGVINRMWQDFSASIGHFVDTHGQVNALVLMCSAIVVLALLKNLVNYLSLLSIAHIRSAVSSDLRSRLYARILELPLAFFTNERKGDLISRMTNDLMEVEFSVIGTLEALLKSPVMVLISLITLFGLSWKLTLFSLVFLPLSGFLISRIAKSLKNAAKRGKGTLGNLISLIEETLTGNRIIKVFNAEQSFTEKFEKQNKAYFRLMTRLYRREYLSSPMSEFISLVVISILLFAGGRIVLAGELDGKLLIFYLVVFSQIIQPARAFSDAIFKINKGVASLERVNEILHAEVTVKDKPDARPLAAFNDAIEFRNVTFGYYGDPVIRDFNLTLKKGQTVALVGPSGSGKSTLASLLARFYDPISGDVLLDGHPLSGYHVQDVRALLGFVSQDAILFNDSVRNNIALGQSSIDEARILQSARIANAMEFIERLEGTFDYNIGDGGNKLSGGQKQRLAIARAVYKNPPILILDEATSALDTQSEKLVQEAIYKLMENRTSLVIAHRLSTIRKADLIAVVEHGRLVQSGTHESLMATPGLYRNLVEMQTFGT